MMQSSFAWDRCFSLQSLEHSQGLKLLSATEKPLGHCRAHLPNTDIISVFANLIKDILSHKTMGSWKNLKL